VRAALLAAAAGGLAVLAACELAEVTVATPEAVAVIEVVLKAGDTIQTAWLHGTLGAGGAGRVFNATLTVTETASGRVIPYTAAEDSLCLADVSDAPAPALGVCYAARGRPDMIRTGAAYDMELTLPDGRRISGRTVVPQAFTLTRPAATPCSLAPATTLELAWTQATGTSIYIGETRLSGLVAALRRAGVEVPGADRPIDLLALSIGAADTTMTFPGDFGLFERFDRELHPVLLAIRDGLPPDVDADIVIAAADRNYINWVRGGTFNPSGAVRVPSVEGQGTGVFGSIVVRRAALATRPAGLPPCQ
jgi:hypothetical protein